MEELRQELEEDMVDYDSSWVFKFVDVNCMLLKHIEYDLSILVRQDSTNNSYVVIMYEGTGIVTPKEIPADDVIESASGMTLGMVVEYIGDELILQTGLEDVATGRLVEELERRPEGSPYLKEGGK